MRHPLLSINYGPKHLGHLSVAGIFNNINLFNYKLPTISCWRQVSSAENSTIFRCKLMYYDRQCAYISLEWELGPQHPLISWITICNVCKHAETLSLTWTALLFKTQRQTASCRPAQTQPKNGKRQIHIKYSEYRRLNKAKYAASFRQWSLPMKPLATVSELVWISS